MISSPRAGFTLLELALVLLVIGMLVGGILGGRELIRRSEMQSLLSDMIKFRTQVDAFKIKYNALPGDLDTASSYWPTCHSTPSYCNGNGDHMIDSEAAPYEDLKLWLHLALAGMVPNDLTGVGTDGVPSALRALDVNIPRSRVAGVGYMLETYGTNLYGFMRTSAFMAGTMASSGTVSKPIGYAFTAADTQALDDKYDDGIAYLGVLLARNGTDSALNLLSKSDPTACVNGDPSDTTADYILPPQGTTCVIAFRINGF